MRWTTAALLLLMATPAVFAETFASIHGRVVVADDHLPLPGAQVTISGGGLVAPRRVTTDARGRFVFLAIPRGDGYVLSVSAERFYPERRGSIGGVSGGDLLDAETAIRFSNPNLCALTWWTVTRADPTPRYVWPMPAPPTLWLCI